jgi:hypothetical protein
MLRFPLPHNKGFDMNKENLLSLADAYAADMCGFTAAGYSIDDADDVAEKAMRHSDSFKARAALCAALDAADREVETLKYNVDTWYERFMEAAKRCHELQALDADRAALGEDRAN